MNNFQWTSDGNVTLPLIDFNRLNEWLIDVAHTYGKIVGDLNYILCNDDKILKINRQFLNHDYYTDIITFDRSSRGIVRGDIYISVDTVADNAAEHNESYNIELMRVIVHGLLHLCGINDKAPGEREKMEQEENKALACIEKYINFSNSELTIS